MLIPEHLLHTAAQHRARGWQAALVVRHAARHPIAELKRHAEVLLTPEGHDNARTAGHTLVHVAPRVRVHHSPVERCAQTARGLVEGARAAGCDAALVGPVAELAYPFVRDPLRAWPLVEELGAGFIRHWFDGLVATDIFDPPAHAARDQLEAIVRVLGSAPDAHGDRPALNVFVSHDWNVALLREDVLGVRPEEGWPGFLDGIALALDTSTAPFELVVALRERTARRLGPAFATERTPARAPGAPSEA